MNLKKKLIILIFTQKEIAAMLTKKETNVNDIVNHCANPICIIKFFLFSFILNECFYRNNIFKKKKTINTR